MGHVGGTVHVIGAIPGHGKVRRLATGLGFTESPVWTDTGRLLVTSVNRGMVYEVFMDTGATVVRGEPGGGPNGLAATGDDVLICQNGGTAMPSKSLRRPPPSIQRLSMDGRVTTLTSAAFSAPSDGVIGPDGRLWFTDPADHDLGVSARVGAVRALDLTTGVVSLIVNDLFFPNGIVFAPSGDTFYVAESATRRVRQYRQDSTKCWTRRPWNDTEMPGVPDGLAVDRDGHIWVACSFSGQVVQMRPTGVNETVLDLGDEVPTAVCFAGPELDELVITSARRGSVLTVPAAIPGFGNPQTFRTTPAFQPSTPEKGIA